MFCPKCATENQEDLAYCRECGEDLKVISQAMKKHLPIALVSKLDAIVEKKNERLRRDAILNTLMGMILLPATIFSLLEGSSFFAEVNTLVFLLGIFMFFSGVWKFLAYRRSLELRKTPLNIPINDESLPPDISQVEALPSNTEAVTNKLVAVNDSQVASIYCPRCGVQNLENVMYCRDCGTSLDFSVRPQGMERYLPAFLVNKLDAMIAKNEKLDYKPEHKSGRTLVFIGLFFLFVAIIQGLGGNWGIAAYYFVLGFVIAIKNGWELVAYRRKLEKEGKVLDEPSTSMADDFLVFLFAKRLMVAVFLGVALILGGLFYFGIATEIILNLFFPFIIIVGIIFVALFLKFLQNRRLETDIQSLNENLPTDKLPIYDTNDPLEFLRQMKNLPVPDEILEQETKDTLPLASPPLSITEATTKPLEAEVKQIEQEKIPITRKPNKPKD